MVYLKHLIFFFCLSFFLIEQPAYSEETAGSTPSLSNYKLGPGDIISIRVFGEDDLSVIRVSLTDSGTITFPSVGEISVLNKRVGEVEELIASSLRGRVLVNPKVYVSLDQYRPFFIAGGVKRPGGVPYQPALSVAKAVSLGGGYTDKANRNKIFLDLPDGTRKQISEDFIVSPDDNITVLEYDPIFVNGMVREAGSYPYQEGLNVRKAVSLAGGFHERANVNKIFLIRSKDPKQEAVKVTLDVLIEPGDTVTVEESFF
jgi:polysaccharide biosynthesis/export protein VpsN